MNKGIGPLGAVVISAILLVLAVSGYFWFKSDEIPEETNVDGAVSETTEKQWEKYINERLGFSIKLPPEVYDQQEGKYLPLTIYEDGKSNVVYINAVDSEGKTSYESITKALGRRRGGITIGVVKTKTELDSFIKDYFGISCGIEELTAKDRTDYFYVHVGGSEDCVISARTDVVYSPKARKVAAMFPRQDALFYKDPQGLESFDAQIIESFEFN